MFTDPCRQESQIDNERFLSCEDCRVPDTHFQGSRVFPSEIIGCKHVTVSLLCGRPFTWYNKTNIFGVILHSRYFRRRLWSSLCASMWWLFCCADCHVPDTIKQIFRHSFASWVFPSVSDPGFFPGSGSGSDLFSESGSGSWSAKIRILSGKIRIRILEKNVLKLGYRYK